MKFEHSTEALYAFIFAVCVLLALFLLTSCSQRAATQADSKPQVHGQSIVFPAGNPAPERLATERVEEPLERDLAMPGRLVWDEERTVRVFPPFAGRIARILAQPGDRVAAGQPLAEIASADFGQARADARKAQADLALAQKSLDRVRDLHAHGVAALKDLQQAEADHARARAESERASARLRDYGQSEDGAAFVLKSPVAGMVVERNLNPGQEVRPDQPGAPLFVVSDPTRLWVSLDANEADVRLMKPGMPLVIASNQFPDEAFAGTLRQLSDFVDPVARTVKLRGNVPNPHRLLKAEMFVSARVRLPKGDSPTVNAKAVYLDGVRRYVFVRDANGAYVRRPVRTGSEVEGRVAVLAGLQAGERVVTSGGLLLQQILASAPPSESVAAEP